MKIVNMCGGLGNQMFQYAFALALQSRYPDEEVKLDIHHYNTILPKRIGHINMHNGYEIPCVFRNATLGIARPAEVMRLSYYVPDYYMSRVVRRIFPKRSHEVVIPTDRSFYYSEDILKHKGSGYYEGYWQSLSYIDGIRDLLLQHFEFGAPDKQNADMANEIESCNSVGIHVRRGDYIAHPVFGGICEKEYYKRALEKLKQDKAKHTYFIFSNDISWCQDNFADLLANDEVKYIAYNKGNKSYWDMYLMMHCQKLIISNSSFCWWAAYLSDSVQQVYVPDKWANTADKVSMYKDSWIKIKTSPLSLPSDLPPYSKPTEGGFANLPTYGGIDGATSLGFENEPLVSVIMPLYNAERYVEASIRSVMFQTFQSWELIVVDDCSKDSSYSIVEQLANEDGRIHLLKTNKPSGSPTLPRNIGIGNARGRFIAFLDSDDTWLPTKLEEQIPLFKDDATKVAFAYYQKMNAEGDISDNIVKSPKKVNYRQLLKGNVIGNLTGIYDTKKCGKHFFLPVGHEDYAYWLEILKDGGYAVNTNKVLALYRISSESLSANKMNVFRWVWYIYRNIEHLSLPYSCYCFSIYAIKGLVKYMK